MLQGIKSVRIELEGRAPVFECKYAHLAADPAELDEDRVGELWACASKDKGLFVLAMKMGEAERDVRGQLRAIVAMSVDVR